MTSTKLSRSVVKSKAKKHSFGPSWPFVSRLHRLPRVSFGQF
ncbi:rCG58589, isoform CRA_a [Rattus norvegicus]|uniref:RCG58589, isoform CRA_a n=1 Tax=Rattus norvegicus TaxID=10116 RepID=A6KR70_RAT|nr:rCG58589, isoform CRA_a [Rattus norvegicus]